jgi:hypothetical protein
MMCRTTGSTTCETDGTVAVGGFARIYTNAVLRAGDELGFEVEVQSGVGSDDEGTTINFGPSYSFSPWERVRLGFNASATYARVLAAGFVFNF